MCVSFAICYFLPTPKSHVNMLMSQTFSFAFFRIRRYICAMDSFPCWNREVTFIKIYFQLDEILSFELTNDPNPLHLLRFPSVHKTNAQEKTYRTEFTWNVVKWFYLCFRGVSFWLLLFTVAKFLKFSIVKIALTIKKYGRLWAPFHFW